MMNLDGATYAYTYNGDRVDTHADDTPWWELGHGVVGEFMVLEQLGYCSISSECSVADCRFSLFLE